MINNEINERIKILAKELKLPYTIRNLAEEINEANLENKSYDSFLCEILEREYELRKENGRKSRIRLAKFPYKRYIEDLILEDLPEDARNKVKIFSCKCQCQNVFFLESQNVQLLEFNVQKNLILIIHLCF